jgi:hypothetical protein
MTEKLRTPTDDQLGTLLGEAISARVDAIAADSLGRAGVSGVVVTRPTRRRWAALAAVVVLVGGLGAAASIRVASRPTKPTPIQVVSPTVETALPHLVAHAEGWRPMSYLAAANTTPSRLEPTFHVRNGRTWFVVQSADDQVFSFPSEGRALPISVGAATGQLVEHGNSWEIRWELGGQRFRASGNGAGNRSPSPDTLDALAALPSDPARIAGVAFPHGFTATRVERPTGGYQLHYVPRDSRQQIRQLSINVMSPLPFFDDYKGGMRFVDRGDRRYYVPTDVGGLSTVIFRLKNSFVHVGVGSSVNDLLDFADTIIEATPEEWAEIVALPESFKAGPYEPPPNVLVDGDIGAVHYELIADDRSEST